MLQHSWTGEVAFLRHMAHQQQDRVSTLGVLDQHGCALSNLGNTTRGRFHTIQVHHLDRVDHNQFGLHIVPGRTNRFHIGLGHDVELTHWQLQPSGPHRDLCQTLFTGDIQGRVLLGELTQGLNQQRALASTGATGD